MKKKGKKKCIFIKLVKWYRPDSGAQGRREDLKMTGLLSYFDQTRHQGGIRGAKKAREKSKKKVTRGVKSNTEEKEGKKGETMKSKNYSLSVQGRRKEAKLPKNR